MLKNVWLPISVALAPLLLILVLWVDIPQVVAIHWNAMGEVDGRMPKMPGVILLPVFNILLAGLLVFLPVFDPRLKRLSKEECASTLNVYALVSVGCASLLSFFSILVVAFALGWVTDMVHPLIYGVCALLLVIGIYLPKVRPNSLIGIRVPWTLNSPEVWRRTHRIVGIGMAGFAAVWILLLTVLPLRTFVWSVFLPMLVGGVLALLVIPYYLSRQIKI